VTSHSMTPTPARSASGADGSSDALTLVWDLTVHRLHRAFAECLAPPPGPTRGGQAPPADSMSDVVKASAGIRLAASYHAVLDIQDALDRMAAGTYGTCQRCAQPIAAERLLAAPTTRWCPTCQVDRG
jgi:RNA polymerase-binding transcription factor